MLRSSQEIQEAIDKHGAKYIFGTAGACLFAGFAIGAFKGFGEARNGMFKEEKIVIKLLFIFLRLP
jgi:hypothetical protein